MNICIKVILFKSLEIKTHQIIPNKILMLIILKLQKKITLFTILGLPIKTILLTTLELHHNLVMFMILYLSDIMTNHTICLKEKEDFLTLKLDDILVIHTVHWTCLNVTVGTAIIIVKPIH
mmetsp:Transcript_6516/g.13660  ORF Transcript_6516/g.13660 Transcript_6516/m.13660 type:complete len:121 (+) Transcript_6516:393-755(+)